MSLLSNLLTGTVTNLVTGTIPSTGLSNIEFAYAGDSNAFEVFQDDSGATFISTLDGYGITATVSEAARSGSTLLESIGGATSWWDDTGAGAIGDLWAAEIGILSNKDDITDLAFSITINDILDAGTISKSAIKTAYQGLIDYAFANLPSLERFYIIPLFRPITASNFDEWADIREVEQELVSENPNVYRMGEAWHLAMRDNVHLNVASRLLRQEILATRIAGVGGNTTNTGEGMLIQTAQVVDDGIELNITHKDGTDWTLPADSTNTKLAIQLYTDGTRLSAIAGDIMSKNSATQAKITCNPITDCSIVVVDGSITGIGGVDVTPDIALDNSDLGLPFGRSTPTITYADPILGMPKIKVACKPSFTKTYSSGTLIDTVTSVNEDTWAPNDAANRTSYDATAFSNAGGFVSSGQAYRLEVTELINENFVMMGVVEIPSSPSDDVNIFELGASGAPNVNNRTYIDASDGFLKHRAIDGSTATGTVSAVDYRGTTMTFIINGKTQDAWDFYINSSSVTAADFNPNNNYTARTNVYWAGGDATYGAMYLKIGAALGETGDLTAAEIIAALDAYHNL